MTHQLMNMCHIEIIKQATRKQCTAKEIMADQQTREAQEAQELAAQNSINRVGESREERYHTLKGVADDAMDIGGDCKLEPEAKPKRKKKENLLLYEAVGAARLKKQNKTLSQPDDLIMVVDYPGRSVDGKAHGLDKKGNNVKSKKFSLSGKINNWCDQVEPDSKGKYSKATSVRSGTSVPCSTTDSRLSGVTLMMTFSQATEPPPTPTKTSKSQDNHALKATCSNNDDDRDSEEHAAAITEKGKGKAAINTVIEIESSTDTELHIAPITGNEKNKAATGMKPILQESDTDDNDSDDGIPNMPLAVADLPYDRQVEIVKFALVEQVPHTSKRKLEEVMSKAGLEDNSYNYQDGDQHDVMAFGDDIIEPGSENRDMSPVVKKILKVPHLAKWVKSEASEPASRTLVTLEPAISGTTVPESMLADMATCGQFIPTVLLWAGYKPYSIQCIQEYSTASNPEAPSWAW
ncbi:hypothetical protein DFH29DRAFT_874267 [Suillus ampliporus]|nr:hypothetical protein DFH29DRAFT_874267 [Suillus ampliporus]